jgi:hypothetical protein
MFDGSLLPRRQLDAWYHPAFAPLPRAILQGMRTTDPVEMPTRQAFEDAFFQFLKELPMDLAEVSIFKPEAYIDIARAVVSGDVSNLPSRVKFWTSFHHVSSGSRKYNLLILPREPYFNMGAEKEERLRNEYIAEVDGDVSSSKGSGGSSSGTGTTNTHEAAQAFFRIPVVFQLYDILIYGHKNHASSSVSLSEIRQAGIVRPIYSSPSPPRSHSCPGLCDLANGGAILSIVSVMQYAR